MHIVNGCAFLLTLLQQAIRVKLDELKKSLHEFKMNHAGAETSVDPVEEGSPEKKAAETGSY